MRYRLLCLTCLPALSLLGAACSGDGTARSDGGADGGMIVLAGPDLRQQGSLTVTLPQAVDGAMWANPAVYDSVPLRVLAPGAAEVKVSLGGVNVPVQMGPAPGSFIASLPIKGLADGTSKIIATASAPGSNSAMASADLVTGTQGVQFTSYAKVGPSRSAHLSFWNGGLYVTWSDFAQPVATAWMQRIDGAGRPLGAQAKLIDDKEDVLYARVAAGRASVGVLYQKRGAPYRNWFKVVDFKGQELLAPLALDPPDFEGTPWGDIDFDGSGFVAAYRSDPDKMGAVPAVYWVRVDEATHKVTGPVAVAQAGMGNAMDPPGGFVALSWTTVRALGNTSVVSFLRDEWSVPLIQAIPKAQYAIVGQDGQVQASFYGGNPAAFYYHWEGRIYRGQDQFVPLWTARDLNDPMDNPPTLFFATKADPTTLAMDLLGMSGKKYLSGSILVNQPDDRAEPFLVPHPEHLGVLLWEDDRTYTLTPDQGRIQLYAAPIDDDLKSSPSVIFDHARFIQGTAELNGVTAGTNVILVWLDERHGRGIAMPTPEVYFETAWY